MSNPEDLVSSPENFEKETLSKYPPKYLDDLMFKYPDIKLVDLDELLTAHPQITPDGIDKVMDRFTFMTLEKIKTYFDAYPQTLNMDSFYSSLENDPEISAAYPPKIDVIKERKKTRSRSR